MKKLFLLGSNSTSSLFGMLATLTVTIAFAALIAFPTTSEAQTDSIDDLQHSIRVDQYRVAAERGAVRGETLYYYKCWMCHNQYARTGPILKDLYKRSNLLSGEPVDDGSVAAQIANGGPGMPSFRTSLIGTDLADLLSYLRDGKCCMEGDNPAANPWYRASTNKWPVQDSLSGGAQGVVRIANSESAEGVKVQLIAPNGLRTTVYADEDGHYQFPKMQTGKYTLRIATPLEFKPYRRDEVEINGGTKLDEIVLERITGSEFLPATPDIESQLSGAELLWNLPGTVEQKDAVRRACGPACHSYQQILRNRYDERSWRVLVNRMLQYGSAPLINRSKNQSENVKMDTEIIVKWLSQIRGPDSIDAPLRIFPRPQGAATRVVVTEYELPRVLLSPHDVYGDSKGNIWYTSHKTPFIGRLDSRTGVVTEYAVPSTTGILPGTHHIAVDKSGIVWMSENWAHNLTKLDPQTGKFTQTRVEATVPINSAGFGNFALSPDGSIWTNQDSTVQKLDPETGKVVKRYPLTKTRNTYDNIISADGNFWAGGSAGGSYGNSAGLLDIRTGKMIEFDTGSHLSNPRRGGFDLDGNAWFGGGGGSLVELDAKAGRMREYWPPTPYAPYTDFYEAMPDKNGEIWAGLLHGRGFIRFNPRTERWIEYVLPEPFGYDRRTWIDNSTNSVTVWYVDYSTGCIVRVQPLE